MGMVIDVIIDFLAQGNSPHIFLEKGSIEIALRAINLSFQIEVGSHLWVCNCTLNSKSNI